MGYATLFFIMNHYPSHRDELVRLRRIEGQVRGVQKMIHEGRYCVDILTTLNAVRGAVKKVEDQVLKRHLEGCVTRAVRSSSRKERGQKIGEILALVSDFRRH